MALEIYQPDIQIGKRYLWKPEPVEGRCPGCGIILCSSFRGVELKVIVESQRHKKPAVQCSDCLCIFPLPFSGWYEVRSLETQLVYAAPFTQLYRMDSESYD